MAKLFEKIDDNPGSYFGMLVEGYEDLAYDDEVPGYEPKKRTWADERYDELMNKGKDNWDQDDWDSYNYIMQVWGESGEFDESLKESIKDWEYVDETYDDPYTPYSPKMYVKFPEGNDTLQVVIYPPQEGASVNDKDYTDWGAEIYSDDDRNISESEEGFSSFDEAEKWINSRLSDLGIVTESLKESKEDLIKKYNMPDREDSLGVKVKLPSSVTLSGDWINKLWEDGVPILKYFDRSPKYLRDIRFAKGREFYVNQNYDKAYFPYKDGWMSVDLSDLEYELGDDWLSGIKDESLKESKEELKYVPKTSTQIARNVIELAVQKFGGKMTRVKSKSSDTTAYAYKADNEDQLIKAKEFIDSKIKLPNNEESLKEDKFVSRDKMSKKDKKELDNKKRNTWGNTNPVTRVQPNKKAYDRKRDKKELDESTFENALKAKDGKIFMDTVGEKLIVLGNGMQHLSGNERIKFDDIVHYYKLLEDAYKAYGDYLKNSSSLKLRPWNYEDTTWNYPDEMY